MPKPTPGQRREWELYFESLGLATIPDGSDTAHVLSVVREQRHRYAHQEDQQALAKLAAAMVRQIREDLPGIDAGDMAAVLVHAATMLSGIAAHEVSGTNVVNIVALMADDLAQADEEGVRELHKPFDDDGVTYCGWDGHEGCGHVWPCPTIRAQDGGDTHG